ncbi:PREDICTED: peptidyl-prolyl cis-trans isomerase Pin1-like [Papilio xuthus]|uniref:Peptidyl-prolyl cis-trans isomerase n=1 Tax=Papilio xuthus TaxID=66420 RepID=A0AAJ7EIZ8_PAPXU|nr:PREDICTED: peptidyl-prolyl cis-trans isomerase Pin1-like [Papilio xuthus]
MAPKRPVPLGWGLRVSRTWGKLFYCNLITGDFQLTKPTSMASLCTDEEFSLSDEGPLRKKKPKMIQVRHILVKHYLSDHSPMCRVLNGEYTIRSPTEAYERAIDIRIEILTERCPFDIAAYRYSESSTAFKGGKLDPIYKGHDMDEAFEEAAFALQIGEISQPVETNVGYHIIQRIS